MRVPPDSAPLPPAAAAPPQPPPPALRLPRDRRPAWEGGVASLLVHAAVLALLLWPVRALLDEGGGGGPGPRGGGGGGAPRASNFVALEPYAPPAAAEPPVEVPPQPPPVVPAVSLPVPEVVPLESAIRIQMPAAATLTGAALGTTGGPGSGTGTGGGQGSGSGTGVGTHEGPGSGGPDSYILRAQPRGIILPPPCAPRGSRYQVRFWVGADGRVTDVDIQPPVRETSCRRDFELRMRGYRFEPAKTREGLAVASVFPITIER